MSLRVFASIALVTFVATALRSADGTPTPKAKLVVLVVFDQLRGDYVHKWAKEFGKAGFERIKTEGTWFSDCRYPFASTATGPGHASMLTGATPSRTGIVNNEWYDRAGATEAYCAGATKYQIVPAPKAEPVDPSKAPAKPRQVGSPERLLSETVADVLKAKYPKGKVFGLSLKDRSGILPSGRKPDGVYWFNGKFITSTYYADGLPDWVKTFNDSGKAERFFGKDWMRLKSAELYDRLAGPDKSDGESKGVGQGIEFPHPMTGGAHKLDAPFASVEASKGKYYDALATSPFGNDVLLDFAKDCIEAEQLGKDADPDLLTVSFSSNDLVGHAWGPDSHEVIDTTLRSDLIVADFLEYLDAKVGAGNYAIVLTADHGICPLPEFSAKYQGTGAKRISAIKLLLGAEKHLREVYKDAEPDEKTEEPKPGEEKPAEPKPPKSRWIEAIPAPNLYLNHKYIASKGLKAEDVAETLATWLREQDGIQAAYTHSVLKSGKLDAYDRIGQLVSKSFHPDRSGDLFIVMKPYYLIGSGGSSRAEAGTNHGSPHDYDRHVPLMVFGPGLTKGTSTESVTPLHAAAIAAGFLGVPAPKDAEYKEPKTLWAGNFPKPMPYIDFPLSPSARAPRP